MDLAPAVDRIRTQCPGYRIVDFSATFEALKARGTPALPAGFVLPGKESGSRNSLGSGGVHNLVRFRFRVYTLVKFAGDAFGQKAMDILEPLRAPLRTALMAWRLPLPPAPPAGQAIAQPDSSIEFGEADFVQFVDGVLVFYDQFEFDGFYRRVP
jgi:hypothetical protein